MKLRDFVSKFCPIYKYFQTTCAEILNSISLREFMQMTLVLVSSKLNRANHIAENVLMEQRRRNPPIDYIGRAQSRLASAIGFTAKNRT